MDEQSVLSKEQITQQVITTLTETFDLDQNMVTPDASLYEDLDLDSIDAIDLIVKLEKEINRKINANDFKHIRTVNDIIETLEKLLNQPA
ncbi:MAG: acyl carrier protein [Methylococcales bacterium]|jgi:acyl carrier protein|nr:acyl carrier protein [Methylococcales bacterium]MBT7408417.1 acyl carrier protein [Methylococcales bacterium]